MENMHNLNITNHHFELIARNELRVFGVSDVHSFNDEGILLETTMGLLTVGGNNLRITKLNLEQGEVCLRGEISTLVYNDDLSSSSRSGGIMSRLFK
ncbi:MAG: sporulation protein YabP [Eubacteriaceae bacterium]|nr:sporulation protein YabP [Eubacteriaceae bacterium]